MRAVHLLVWGREAGGRGVVLGGLGLVEGHAVGHVAVLLLHRLLRLVDVWLLLLLGVGLGGLGHRVSLSQGLRALGLLLLLLLVRHVVLRHSRLRSLLLILWWRLLVLLLLLLRHSVLLLRLLLGHRRPLLLLLLLRHVVLRKLLLRLSGALGSAMGLHTLRRALLRLGLLRRHLLLLLDWRACLRRWWLWLLRELRLRRRVPLLHFDVTLADVRLRLL